MRGPELSYRRSTPSADGCIIGDRGVLLSVREAEPLLNVQHELS